MTTRHVTALVLVALLACHGVAAAGTRPDGARLRAAAARPGPDGNPSGLTLLETREGTLSAASAGAGHLSPEEAEHLRHLVKGFGLDMGIMTAAAIAEHYEQKARAQTFAVLCRFSQPLIKYWERTEGITPVNAEAEDRRCSDCFCDRWELASFLSLVCSEGFNDQVNVVKKMAVGTAHKIAKKIGVATLALVSAPVAATVAIGLKLHKFYKLGVGLHHLSIAGDARADRYLLPATVAMCDLACGCQGPLEAVLPKARAAEYRDVDLVAGNFWYQMCLPLRAEYAKCWFSDDVSDELPKPETYVLTGRVDDRMEGAAFGGAGNGGTATLGSVVDDKEMFSQLVRQCKADFPDAGRSVFNGQILEAMDDKTPEPSEPDSPLAAMFGAVSDAGSDAISSIRNLFSAEDDAPADRSRVVREFDEDNSEEKGETVAPPPPQAAASSALPRESVEDRMARSRRRMEEARAARLARESAEAAGN